MVYGNEKWIHLCIFISAGVHDPEIPLSECGFYFCRSEDGFASASEISTDVLNVLQQPASF